MEQAEAIPNATLGEPDAKRREAPANRIGKLLKRHNTADVALQQVKAIENPNREK